MNETLEFDYSSKTSRLQKNISNTLKDNLRHSGIIPEDHIDNVAHELMKIHGMAPANFDFVKNVEMSMSAQFKQDTIAGMVDDNSNKTEKTIKQIFADAQASFQKITGYDYLYRAMKEIYGKEEAKRLSGLLYSFDLTVSDSTQILSVYCYAADFSKLIIEGRPWGVLHSAPAKRVDSYIQQVLETVHEMSNSLAGAIAISTLFFDIAHLIMYADGVNTSIGRVNLEDIKTNYIVRKTLENLFQTIIHSVNHTSRNGAESPFTNISIFDRTKIKGIYGTMEHMFMDTDYLHGDEKVNYIADLIVELQNIYMDIFEKGDQTKNNRQITFPVSTINMTKVFDDETGKFRVVEQDFLKKVAVREMHRYNINVSTGNRVSMCCFDGGEDCLINSKKDGVMRLSFEELYNSNIGKYKIFHDGSWCNGELVKIPRDNKSMYRIETTNNKVMIATEDHLFPTMTGDIRTDKLSRSNYLMLNSSVLGSNSELDISYEDGIIVGAYLGDGNISSSIHECKNGDISNYNRLILSMNSEKVGIFGKIVDLTNPIWNINPIANNVVSVSTSDKRIINLIQTWTNLGKAHSKSLNLDAIKQSVKFRKGILEGLYITDGGNRNRIYTTSEQLSLDLEVLITSLGMTSVVNIDNRVGQIRPVRGVETIIPKYPVYSVRFYSIKQKRGYGHIYRKFNGNTYFKIKSVEKIKDYEKEYVYCFEMKNKDEPYFTLPNGIITHNCRFSNDYDLLKSLMREQAKSVNSFGGEGIGIGSHRVVPINLNRVALQSKSVKDFKEVLRNRVEDACKVLKAHKELIKFTADKKLQKFISNGWINHNALFSTIGIIASSEMATTLVHKFGNDEDLDFIGIALEIIESSVDEFSSKYEIFGNIEEIPGESMAAKFPKADRAIFGSDVVTNVLYSNQFVPLWEDATIYERMATDGKYQQMLTGGGIVHFQIGSLLTPLQNENLVNDAVEVGCEHFSANPVTCECENGHNTIGDFDTTSCNMCGAEIVSRITRVVGFPTKVENWNKERREWEAPRRVTYSSNSSDRPIIRKPLSCG